VTTSSACGKHCGKTCGKLNGLFNIGKVRWSCCLSAHCNDCQRPLWHAENWHNPLKDTRSHVVEYRGLTGARNEDFRVSVIISKSVKYQNSKNLTF